MGKTTRIYSLLLVLGKEMSKQENSASSEGNHSGSQEQKDVEAILLVLFPYGYTGKPRLYSFVVTFVG